MPPPAKIETIINVILQMFKESLGHNAFVRIEAKVCELTSNTFGLDNPISNAQLIINVMRVAYASQLARISVDFMEVQMKMANELVRIADLDLILAFYNQDAKIDHIGRVNQDLIGKFAIVNVLNPQAKDQITNKCYKFINKLNQESLKTVLIADFLNNYQHMSQILAPYEIAQLIYSLPDDIRIDVTNNLLTGNLSEFNSIVVAIHRYVMFATTKQISKAKNDFVWPKYDESPNYKACAVIMEQNNDAHFALAWFRALKENKMNPRDYPKCHNLAMIIWRSQGVNVVPDVRAEIIGNLDFYFPATLKASDLNRFLENLLDLAKDLSNSNKAHIKSAINCLEFIANRASGNLKKSAHKELGDIYWNGNGIEMNQLNAAIHYSKAGVRCSSCLLLSAAAKSIGMQAKDAVINAAITAYANIQEKLDEQVRPRFGL